MAITHPFVSAKTDSTDATLVRPSNWNDDHTIAASTTFTSPIISGSVLSGEDYVIFLDGSTYKARDTFGNITSNAVLATLVAAVLVAMGSQGTITIQKGVAPDPYTPPTTSQNQRIIVYQTDRIEMWQADEAKIVTWWSGETQNRGPFHFYNAIEQGAFITSQSVVLGHTDTFVIHGSGQVRWGAGDPSALDTTLERTAAGTLSMGSAGILASGSTNTNTLILKANDTAFITLTTGATDVCTITSPTMSGTWLASGTVTIPALTLGGAISGNAQTISNANVTVGASRTLDVSAGTLTLADNQISGDKVEGGTIAAITITTLSATTINAHSLGGNLTLGGYAFDAGAGAALVNTTGSNTGLTITSNQDGVVGVGLQLSHQPATQEDGNVPSNIFTVGKDGSGNATTWSQLQCVIDTVAHASETAHLAWFLQNGGAENTAMTLSGAGALWTDASVDTLLYKVAGTQVVGARVIDARCDDAVNSGDATTDGVIDALRDAMISHGLISAA